jgi:L-ascorbate metabolism protein UlaG (beta-lactamase superfamily)
VRPTDIAWSPDALGRSGGPEDVRVRWLGTAGFALEHAGFTLLLDPYLSRASLARCIAGPLRPDRSAALRYVSRADAIVVGHTHFDHVLDVPFLARTTGARVFGSRSAVALCRAGGVPEAQLESVEGGPGRAPIEREVGPFELRFVPSAHANIFFGRVPFPGDIIDCAQVPGRVAGYRCGAVFGIEIRVAGRTLYHVGSAELVDDNVVARGVDLLLLCVAGWTAGRDVPERIVHRLGPGAVVLSHWDDFFRPLELPARLLPAIALPGLVERLTRAGPGLRVGTLPLLGEVWA